MAETGRSGYDWASGRLPRPPGLNRWIARHRVGVRVTLICIDLVLVTLLVLELFEDPGGNWSRYFLLLVYGVITWQAGWFVPREVDRWRAQHHSDL